MLEDSVVNFSAFRLRRFRAEDFSGSWMALPGSNRRLVVVLDELGRVGMMRVSEEVLGSLRFGGGRKLHEEGL